jgi:hypothetical protein
MATGSVIVAPRMIFRMPELRERDIGGIDAEMARGRCDSKAEYSPKLCSPRSA